MGNQSFSKRHEEKKKTHTVTMNIYPPSPGLWERVVNKETEAGPSKVKKKDVRS